MRFLLAKRIGVGRDRKAWKGARAKCTTEQKAEKEDQAQSKASGILLSTQQLSGKSPLERRQKVQRSGTKSKGTKQPVTGSDWVKGWAVQATSKKPVKT